jgi:acyl dehydratase
MATEAPAKDTERYFEEIDVGETYTVERQRTITETDVVNFAGISGDFHPYHMSTEIVKDTPFDGRIAHGVLVFAIAEALVADQNPRSFTYGHEGLRYPTPTLIGDTLTVHREVVDREEYNDEYGKVVYEYVAENQDDEIVFVCKHLWKRC